MCLPRPKLANIAFAIFLSFLAVVVLLSVGLPTALIMAPYIKPQAATVISVDGDDNLRLYRLPNGQVWHFNYTKKQSGVIIKSYYFIISQVIEPSGKTWDLVDERKHIWQSGSETWTGNWHCAQERYGDYRFGTILKTNGDQQIVLMLHPTGYVAEAKDNGAIHKITCPDTTGWEFEYSAEDDKKKGPPHKHQPTVVERVGALGLGNTHFYKNADDKWTYLMPGIKDFYSVTEKMEWSFTEYRVGSGVHFATLLESSQRGKTLHCPTGASIVLDSKRNVATAFRPTSTSISFEYVDSGLFSSLNRCKEPDGSRYEKKNGDWYRDDGKPANAKFDDESNFASHVGYGALDRIASDDVKFWHATANDIDTDGNYVITAIHYADGTSRRFWYKDAFGGKKLNKFMDRDGTTWSRNGENQWNSDTGKSFHGSFFVESNLSSNFWGYGTFFKYDADTKETELTFNGCPAHVAREKCTNTGGGGPRDGGNQRECHDEYYVVP